MKKLQELVQKVAKSSSLKKKFFFILFIFFVGRLLAYVPVPMINVASLQSIFQDNDLLGIFNIFSGGTLSRFSLVALGVSPYISASIVLQLAGIVLPKLKELQKEGERGREKINHYTRLLTLPLAVIQSISIIVLLQNNNLLLTTGIFPSIAIAMILTAGAFLMTWLGELIGRYGIGNGVSMIMTLGIVSQIPVTISQMSATATGNNLFGILILIVAVLAVVALVTFFNEAVHQVPIQYAKRVHGSRTYGGQATFFPIKVNSTGVLPIIFALTLMAVPPFIGQILVSLKSELGQKIGANIINWFSSNSPTYMITYFLIVFVFTFFSAVILFNAEDIAEELKKSGAFVPGIRPGEKTKLYLQAVVKNITFINAIFLSLMALIPYLLQSLTHINSLAIGGTSILILVSVILETTRQMEGETVSQNYDKYY